MGMGQSGARERVPIGPSLPGRSRIQLTWSMVCDVASLRAAAMAVP